MSPPLPVNFLVEFVPDLPPGPTGRQAFAFLADQVTAAERAGLDAVVVPQPGPDGLPFEPTTVLPALAGLTSRLGLVGQVDSRFGAPYHEARALATADHLSRGRIGWELLPDPGPVEARLHGRAVVMPAGARWARAIEFVQVLRGLWDTWDDDAIRADRALGVHADEDRIHELGHVGEHFAVRGPLNVPRGPQGHPPVSALVDPADPDAVRAAAAVLDVAVVTSIDAAVALRPLVDRPLLLAVPAPRAGESPVAWLDPILDAAASGAVRGIRIAAGFDRPLAGVLPVLRRDLPPGPARTWRARLGVARPAGRRAAVAA